MAALRLHDGIEADAGVGQHTAYGRGGAGLIRDSANSHLGLIPVEGHAAHFRFARTRWRRIEVELPFVEFKALSCRLQGLAALMACHQTAHLHLAGGDQAQVDASLGKGVEQASRHTGTPHDPGTGDAQFGHTALGADRGAFAARPHGG